MNALDTYTKDDYEFSQYRPKKIVNDIEETVPVISSLNETLTSVGEILTTLTVDVIKSDLWIQDARNINNSIVDINTNLKSTTTTLLNDIDEKFSQISSENAKLSGKISTYKDKMSKSLDTLSGLKVGSTVLAATTGASLESSGISARSLERDEGIEAISNEEEETLEPNEPLNDVPDNIESNNSGSAPSTGTQPSNNGNVESNSLEDVATEQGSSDTLDDLTATNVQYSQAPSSGLVDTSKYHSNPDRGFVVTTDNPTYNLSDSDIEILTAIVSAESDKSYDDALAVASTIFNRCEEPRWASCGGSNPVKQATAPNQFVVYQHGSYKKYMGSGAPDTCRQAVLDVINGARNHSYLSFRSNGSTGYSGNMITSTGNRYK